MSTSVIPVIDVSPLYNDGVEGRNKVAAEIGAACRDIGFFCISGHGVDPELIAKVFSMSAALFDAGPSILDEVRYSPTSQNRGYIPMKGESLDPRRPPDLKEAFNVGLELAPDDPDIEAGVKFRAPNLWPEIEGFRDTILAYFNAVWALGRILHEAFATDLGVAPDFFNDKLDKPMAILRLLHYPPRPKQLEQGQLGAGEHTDYGCVTLLATDEAGGLEVRSRADEWVAVPHLPGIFICNIGDCLMRWTNDVYVSTPHRVVNPAGRKRYSVAFFLDPNPDAVVECLTTCVSDDRPAKYDAIRGDEFLLSRLNPTYQKSGLAATM